MQEDDSNFLQIQEDDSNKDNHLFEGGDLLHSVKRYEGGDLLHSVKRYIWKTT